VQAFSCTVRILPVADIDRPVNHACDPVDEHGAHIHLGVLVQVFAEDRGDAILPEGS